MYLSSEEKEILFQNLKLHFIYTFQLILDASLDGGQQCGSAEIYIIPPPLHATRWRRQNCCVRQDGQTQGSIPVADGNGSIQIPCTDLI